MRIPLFIIRGLFFLCAVGTGSYLAKLAHEPQTASSTWGSRRRSRSR
jgi:hypothetical protein